MSVLWRDVLNEPGASPFGHCDAGNVEPCASRPLGYVDVSRMYLGELCDDLIPNPVHRLLDSKRGTRRQDVTPAPLRGSFRVDPLLLVRLFALASEYRTIVE